MLAGGAIAGSQLAVARAAHAFGSDTIRVGVVGCGARGTAAVIQALNTADHSADGGDVQLVAMADVFGNHLHSAYRSIKGAHPERVEVGDRRYQGLDAYQGVMASHADVVILATPPGFRPVHFEAAVDAGKHVFMEKPLATDAPGVRRILAANGTANKKKLAVQVGLQRRHEQRYRDCIDRLHRGDIGELIVANAYTNNNGARVRPRSKRQSELEYQLRNWSDFTWLGGDPIVEQHVQNLDVINWIKGSVPVDAQGQGGREQRSSQAGQTFDHHAVEFTYADGFKLFSQCRQLHGGWRRVGEQVLGQCGSCDISQGIMRDASGKVIWRSASSVSAGKGWQSQMNHLFDSLRSGCVPNDCVEAANSTMTAILGRMATYSGQLVTWDQAIANDERSVDHKSLHALSDAPPVQRDAAGNYAVARPGTQSLA